VRPAVVGILAGTATFVIWYWLLARSSPQHAPVGGAEHSIAPLAADEPQDQSPSVLQRAKAPVPPEASVAETEASAAPTNGLDLSAATASGLVERPHWLSIHSALGEVGRDFPAVPLPASVWREIDRMGIELRAKVFVVGQQRARCVPALLERKVKNGDYEDYPPPAATASQAEKTAYERLVREAHRPTALGEVVSETSYPLGDSMRSPQVVRLIRIRPGDDAVFDRVEQLHKELLREYGAMADVLLRRFGARQEGAQQKGARR